jgi:hypothetical protein
MADEGTVKLNIVDPDGIKAVTVSAPKELKVENLIDEFVQQANLPRFQGDDPITYGATLKRNNTELVTEKTISEAGLKEDDTIRLKQTVNAKTN